VGAFSVVISQASQKPIYLQIEEQVISLIVSGALSEGEELPSIRNLARDLRISVITTKRAYDDLEASGFVTTVAGKGTYVSVKNREFFREQKLRRIEGKLEEAVGEARAIGMSLEEMIASLTLLHGGHTDGHGSEG
jgi:GntR family transcriptional regulator